jgi:membrane-bound lytic murein transglycosylase D
VDKWIDERRDPEKATYAAADYLKSLYALFNDWDLATAGYNAGEGKILKAVKRAKTQEFWKISQSRFLKKETKEYVPMFLAAVTIAQNPLKYGFQNIEYSPPLVYEKVTVPPNMSLSVIAMAAESDLSHIQALNPALKKGKTPPHSSFEIKLPLGKKEIFENNFPILSPMPASGRKYRVGKGESLRKIAQKHKLTLRALCDLNDLSPKSRLQSGTVLLLPPL